MSVLTFSRHFPKGHPRVSEPTYFMEKIHKSLDRGLRDGCKTTVPPDVIGLFNFAVIADFEPKGHTIRSGFRFKVGDWFTPRVWGNDINPKSGRTGPYQSKQLTFAPDIQIKKIWTFTIDKTDYYLDGRKLNYNDLRPIALNDGLATDDFECWFDCHPKAKNGFSGQILCWDESIEYT